MPPTPENLSRAPEHLSREDLSREDFGAWLSMYTAIKLLLALSSDFMYPFDEEHDWANWSDGAPPKLADQWDSWEEYEQIAFLDLYALSDDQFFRLTRQTRTDRFADLYRHAITRRFH